MSGCLKVIAFSLVVSLLCAGCGGSGGPLVLTKVGADPATSTAGLPLDITVAATEGGSGKAGVAVSFEVDLGGGKLSQSTVTTDGAGKATVSWTIGTAPVKNAVSASVSNGDAGTLSVSFETVAKPDKPLAPDWFADVNKYMTDNKLDGSTEDLAFSLDGKKIAMGIPGGVLTVDSAGAISSLPLTGDKLGTLLGLDYDSDGNIWLCDNGNGKDISAAVRMISSGGVVSTVITDDGAGTKLGKPNFIVAAPDGQIYFTDPCIGKVLRWDPVAKKITGSITVDYKTEGGPNGIAIDSTGKKLYFTTENTAALCGHSDVDFETKNSALFFSTITADALLNKTAIKENFAHFGDGVTFDGEGNLYAIFDNIDFKKLTLKDSTVWVMPAGQTELYKYLQTTDRIMANLTFGKGDFGDTTMYISLLASIGVPAEARGLNRFVVGIKGQ
ncbi:MAG: hypothetical protein WC889_08890 [Myxococcota bacterium]|jgi:sugar lactone lactonase YvrE